MTRQFIFQMFLSQLMGEPLRATRLSFRRDEKSSPIYMLYKTIREPEDNQKKPHPATIPIMYPAVRDKIDRMLDNWASCFFKSSPSFNALWSFETRSGPFDHYSFLAVAQSIESYYGNVVKTNANNTYIKEALQKTMKRQSTPTRHLICKQVTKFYRKIHISRNYYAHFNPKHKKYALKGTPLYYATMKVVVLMKIDLLRRIGLTEKEAVDALMRHQQLGHWLRFKLLI